MVSSSIATFKVCDCIIQAPNDQNTLIVQSILFNDPFPISKYLKEICFRCHCQGCFIHHGQSPLSTRDQIQNPGQTRIFYKADETRLTWMTPIIT